MTIEEYINFLWHGNIFDDDFNEAETEGSVSESKDDICIIL